MKVLEERLREMEGKLEEETRRRVELEEEKRRRGEGEEERKKGGEGRGEGEVEEKGKGDGDVREWGRIFSLLDRNNDGVLTPREIVLGFRKHPEIAEQLGLTSRIEEGSTRDDLMRMFGDMDKDQDDLVTRDEFIQFELQAHNVYVRGKKGGGKKGGGGGGGRERSLSLTADKAELVNTGRRMGCYGLSVVVKNWQGKVCGRAWSRWFDRVQYVRYERKVAREYNHIRDIMGAFSRLQSHAE